MYSSMEEDDDDDEKTLDDLLPEGVTIEQAHALVEAVVEAVEKLGLYSEHAHLAVPDADAQGAPLMIHAIFTFGKVAFTPRIQNPEQDEFDDKFRKFEAGEIASTAADIVESFKRGPKNP